MCRIFVVSQKEEKWRFLKGRVGLAGQGRGGSKGFGSGQVGGRGMGSSLVDWWTGG